MDKTFYVSGMHCPACEVLIEDKLSEINGVTKVKATLNNGCVQVCSLQNFAAEDLSKCVEKYGYAISDSPKKFTPTEKIKVFQGFTIALSIFILFLLLQKLGIVNLLNPTSVTLPIVFVIGVVASLSTCMAVVGGLVLSLSSKLSTEKNLLAISVFHISRLVGFFILGGLIGLLGRSLALNSFAYFVMDTILFIVMLLLGLNMLNLFEFTKKFQIKMPKFVGKRVMQIDGNKNILAAGLLGVLTFVLPCGFTQSMQLYALTTGNFYQAAITMFVFALGTLPVLSLISFLSFQIKSKVFFSAAGFLIIFFAIFNFWSGLRAIGIL